MRAVATPVLCSPLPTVQGSALPSTLSCNVLSPRAQWRQATAAPYSRYKVVTKKPAFGLSEKESDRVQRPSP